MNTMDVHSVAISTYARLLSPNFYCIQERTSEFIKVNKTQTSACPTGINSLKQYNKIMNLIHSARYMKTNAKRLFDRESNTVKKKKKKAKTFISQIYSLR